MAIVSLFPGMVTGVDAGWKLADVRIAINDMGATPAVVSLRLDQAVAELPAAAQGARP